MPSDADPCVPLDHARIRRVEGEIFRVRFAPDCMTHRCRDRDDHGRVRLDACCQHGADVGLNERDAILARRAEVASALRPEFADPARWFDESEAEADPDFPSGTVIRTGLAGPGEDGGCVFLEHDRRGCGLHRAALASGFAPAEIKPMVCRLYPLAFGEATLGLSDDFPRYSCSRAADAPTVYRLMRPVVAEVFGLAAVRRLDRAERALTRRSLPVAARV